MRFDPDSARTKAVAPSAAAAVPTATGMRISLPSQLLYCLISYLYIHVVGSFAFSRQWRSISSYPNANTLEICEPKYGEIVSSIARPGFASRDAHGSHVMFDYTGFVIDAREVCI